MKKTTSKKQRNTGLPTCALKKNKKSICWVFGCYALITVFASCWLYARKPTSELAYFMDSTFNYLANTSDVIGMGNVVRYTDSEFDVQTLHSLVGCTNGQIFTFAKSPGETGMYPTNLSQIVFSVATNEYFFSIGRPNVFSWDIRVAQPFNTRTNPVLWCLARTWFYTDDANGETYQYFTNVVQNMRIQKNWTNYYEICRSAIHSQSKRAREDLMFDLDEFLGNYVKDVDLQEILNDPTARPQFKQYVQRLTTEAQIQYALNDPLLDQRVKNYIHAIDAHYEMLKIDPDFEGWPPDLEDFFK